MTAQAALHEAVLGGLGSAGFCFRVSCPLACFFGPPARAQLASAKRSLFGNRGAWGVPGGGIERLGHRRKSLPLRTSVLGLCVIEPTGHERKGGRRAVLRRRSASPNRKPPRRIHRRFVAPARLFMGPLVRSEARKIKMKKDISLAHLLRKRRTGLERDKYSTTARGPRA